MKKILLVLALVFAFFTSIAQESSWESYRNEVGTWNRYTQKWVYGEMNHAIIPIIFNKESVQLINKAMSVFTIINDEGKTSGYNNEGVKYSSHAWIALDKDGRKCRISMHTYDSDKYDPIMFNVMYDDVLLRFYCRMSNKLDSYLNN